MAMTVVRNNRTHTSPLKIFLLTVPSFKTTNEERKKHMSYHKEFRLKFPEKIVPRKRKKNYDTLSVFSIKL